MIVLKKVESLDSFDDAKTQLNLLIDKFNEIEERKSVRDVGMFEEISHFRRESREGLQRLERKFDGLESKLGNVESKLGNLENKFEDLESKVDANTLAIQSLEKVTQGGFDNIGKLLQEISKKLG